MSYAVSSDGFSWRAVNSPDDMVDGERYSETLPVPSLEVVRAEAINRIDAACAAAIVSGFGCDALVSGTAYTYPSKITDQSNLSASVLASVLPGIPEGWTTDFWCADPAGVWALRPHNAAQIQRVGMAVQEGILALIQKKAELEAQIDAATTMAAVQAVVWG